MTFLETIQAAGLPIVSVNADGSEPRFARPLTDEEVTQYIELKLQYFDTIAYNNLINERADKKQLRDEFQTTITQLQNIEAATSPTNAQVIAAVKFLARTLRLLLKLLARLI